MYCFEYGKPILYADDLKVIFLNDLAEHVKPRVLIFSDLLNVFLWKPRKLVSPSWLLIMFNLTVKALTRTTSPLFNVITDASPLLIALPRAITHKQTHKTMLLLTVRWAPLGVTTLKKYEPSNGTTKVLVKVL